jgi:hypothetical protein
MPTVRMISLIAAFDLGPISFGPTPLAMLLVVILLALVVIAFVAVGSQVGGKLVDARWPANQPLRPSEVLWGESGGHVAKNFPGLDPEIGKDLTQYMKMSKVAAGDTIIERGDLPTHFVLIKSGAAERIDDSGSTSLPTGTALGSDNIMRREPFGFSVRATAACELIRLEAEDYLAAVAFGMSDDDDDYVVHALSVYLDPAAPPITAPPPPAAVAVATRQWSAATHYVSAAQLGGYILPAGDAPTMTLVADTEVEVFEQLPGWAHVRLSNGWQGWVEASGLTAID